MKRIAALVALALLCIAAQQLPDESNIAPNEKRIPPGHYCKAPGVTIRPNEPAHTCDCTYTCTIDEQGNVTEHESSSCLAYCHINGRHCTCHVEDPTPCEKQAGNARMDMDGHVVSVRAHR